VQVGKVEVWHACQWKVGVVNPAPEPRAAPRPQNAYGSPRYACAQVHPYAYTCFVRSVCVWNGGMGVV